MKSDEKINWFYVQDTVANACVTEEGLKQECLDELKKDKPGNWECAVVEKCPSSDRVHLLFIDKPKQHEG